LTTSKRSFRIVYTLYNIQEEKLKTKVITLVVLILFAAVNIVALDLSALKGLRKQSNKVDGVKWFKYKSKKTPANNFKKISGGRDFDNSMFYLYISTKENKEAFLHMYAQVEPIDDWIKFKKIIITADKETFEREFNFATINNTIGHGQQYIEFYDVEVMPHEIKMFEKIAAAKEVKITFQGDENSQDMELKDRYKEAVKDIVDAWKKLNPEG
jgi:hypothetical protein